MFYQDQLLLTLYCPVIKSPPRENFLDLPQVAHSDVYFIVFCCACTTAVQWLSRTLYVRGQILLEES